MVSKLALRDARTSSSLIPTKGSYPLKYDVFFATVNVFSCARPSVASNLFNIRDLIVAESNFVRSNTHFIYQLGRLGDIGQ